MDTRSVIIRATKLECIDEGDGWGSAEPYLWTTFITFDGTTIRQDPDDSARLIGAPQFRFGLGSHGNIGPGGVDDGDEIDVPPSVGFFAASIEPIALNFFGQSFDVPAAMGIISVMMEEDNVSNSGAEAGHQALNALIEERVTTFVAALDLNQIAGDALALPGPDPLPEKALTVIRSMLDQLADELINDAQSVVANAIQGSQGLFANLWSLLNPDDFVGTKMTVRSVPELLPADSVDSFVQELNSPDGDGSYELTWEARVTKPRIPIGVLPAGERFEISAIATRHSHRYDVDYITHVGGEVNGDPWIVTRGQGVQLIDAGFEFYTDGPGSQETEVRVAVHDSGTRYLRTVANNTDDDNLLSLPELSFHYDE